MNLHGLGKVETPDGYLDIAFKNGIAAAAASRAETTTRNKILKSKRIETARITATGKSLISSLLFVLKSFPSIDTLDPFYQELIKCTLEYDKLKKSLGALNWAQKQISFLLEKYLTELQRNTQLTHFNKARTAFSGRISSVMKQIKDNLAYLEYTRKVMKSYPSFKTSVSTIVIAGMPNVGKSTLLAALTDSKPKIASYPFTTQSINLGYDEDGNQYVDTPGLLDRPLSARNTIERQAILALKHLATIIIFVFDPTEQSGYSINEQKSLLAEIKKLFNIELILVSNKSDTGTPIKGAMPVSAKEGIGIPELRKEISSLLSLKQKGKSRQE